MKKGFKSLPKLIDERIKGGKIPRLNAVVRSVSVVRTDIVNDIQQGSKTGITYQKYNPKRTHTASREGEAPATDTGELVREITTSVFTRKKGGGDEVVGQIVSGAPYSKHLEFGTTKMKPRPFMQKNLEKNRKKIRAIFKEEGLIR
jgi:HK97 gp10 family phage protein